MEEDIYKFAKAHSLPLEDMEEIQNIASDQDLSLSDALKTKRLIDSEMIDEGRASDIVEDL